ncbi:MAG: hypothetical protein JXB62_07100 [Pirellulales bacterium]|nr:hypothetical protein [Pirellulales bacterium]
MRTNGSGLDAGYDASTSEQTVRIIGPGPSQPSDLDGGMVDVTPIVNLPAPPTLKLPDAPVKLPATPVELPGRAVDWLAGTLAVGNDSGPADLLAGRVRREGLLGRSWAFDLAVRDDHALRSNPLGEYGGLRPLLEGSKAASIAGPSEAPSQEWSLPAPLSPGDHDTTVLREYGRATRAAESGAGAIGAGQSGGTAQTTGKPSRDSLGRLVLPAPGTRRASVDPAGSNTTEGRSANDAALARPAATDAAVAEMDETTGEVRLWAYYVNLDRQHDVVAVLAVAVAGREITRRRMQTAVHNGSTYLMPPATARKTPSPKNLRHSVHNGTRPRDNQADQAALEDREARR